MKMPCTYKLWNRLGDIWLIVKHVFRDITRKEKNR